MRKVAVIATASGNGKTTFGRALAERLGVPFVEMDALVHGPGWVETPDDELRARVEPILAGDGWVVDGVYQRKLGRLIPEAADTVVWLDLPMRVWLPRLVRRTARRWWRREELWNGNRESLRTTLFSSESVIWYALRNHRRRRRAWSSELNGYPVVRLHSVEEVERWLATSS
jgi:adenylate kinase family enzyme